MEVVSANDNSSTHFWQYGMYHPNAAPNGYGASNGHFLSIYVAARKNKIKLNKQGCVGEEYFNTN